MLTSGLKQGRAEAAQQCVIQCGINLPSSLGRSRPTESFTDAMSHIATRIYRFDGRLETRRAFESGPIMQSVWAGHHQPLHRKQCLFCGANKRSYKPLLKTHTHTNKDMQPIFPAIQQQHGNCLHDCPKAALSILLAFHFACFSAFW